MALFYSIIVAIIVVNGCDDDSLLIPEFKIGDTKKYELPRLADGLYWQANNVGGGYLYFYYPSEVQVKWIFVQRYHNQATYLNVYDGSNTIAYQYFGDSTEYNDSVTIRFNDVYTDLLRFYFYHSSTVRVSRVEVHGCYKTSTPTTSPTTEVFTGVPRPFPSVSPTSVPRTTFPSDVPTTFLSTAPTVSPFVHSLFPSISPTSSQNEPLTVVYAASVGFWITLGGIDFFVMVIFCLCGILLFVYLRYRRTMLVNEVLHIAADIANHTDNSDYRAEDHITQTRKSRNKQGVKVKQTGNPRSDVEERALRNNRTRNIVGEHGIQVASHHHVDVPYALDEVSRNNGKVVNGEGDLKNGPQDSAL